jgi:hypothetical protein
MTMSGPVLPKTRAQPPPYALGETIMTPHALLSLNHEKIRALIREYNDAGERTSEKRDAAEQLLIELQTHSRQVQDVLCPALRERVSDLGSIVDTAVEYQFAVEEAEFLPKVATVLRSDAEQVGARMVECRKELTRELLPNLGRWSTI